MSKILALSTSVLALTANFAFADVTITAGATAGIKSEDGGDNFDPDASIGVTFEGSGKTDSGIEYGGSVTIDSGNLANSATDLSANGEVNAPKLFLRGSFGEFYMNENDDDEPVGGYKYTWQNTDLNLEYNWDTDASIARITQHFGDFYLAGEANTLEEWLVKAGYDNKVYRGSVEYNEDGRTKVSAGITQDAFSVDGSYNTDDEWDVGVGFTVGAATMRVEYEHDEDWLASVNYALSDKLGLYASGEVEDQEPAEIKAGVSFKF